MPTTGVLNGTSLGVYVNNTKIAKSKSATISIQMNTRDASSKDSAGWREVLEGQMSWEVSADALTAFDAAYGVDELFDALVSRQPVTVAFTTNVTGDTVWSGTAYVTSVEISAEVEDSSTYSVQFVGTGALTKATVV